MARFLLEIDGGDIQLSLSVACQFLVVVCWN